MDKVQVRFAISGAHGSGKTYIVDKLMRHFNSLGLSVGVITSSTRTLKKLGYGINTEGAWETQLFSATNRVQSQLEATKEPFEFDLIIGDRCVGDELAYNNWHLASLGDTSQKELWIVSDLLIDLFVKEISGYWDAILWKRPHPDYPPVDDGDRSNSLLYQEQIDGRFKALYQPTSADERLYGLTDKISTLPLDRDEALEVAKGMITEALYSKGILKLPESKLTKRTEVELKNDHDEENWDDYPEHEPSPSQILHVREAVRTILQSNGENPDRPGLRETPDRVARMFAELFSGIGEDPSVHLKLCFLTESSSMVIIKDIPFTSLCEHHLLPFTGVAHIGYIPGKFEGDPPGTIRRYRIAGLSKFGRVVDGFARRPQVQEELTHQIARCIQSNLRPQGVIVVMEAQHSCMVIRGVKKSGSLTLTSSVTGIFDKNTDNVKGEFFSLLALSK